MVRVNTLSVHDCILPLKPLLIILRGSQDATDDVI